MNSIIGIAVKDTRTFFREKGTIFWTIAFPILIMLLFTAIFGREIPFNASVGIVDYDHTPATASIISGNASLSNMTKIFTVINYTDVTEARKELDTSTIRALILIPKNFTQNLLFFKNASISLIVDETNPDIARLCQDGIKTYFAMYYKFFNPNYTEPITLSYESVKGLKIGYKENIVPGMLCYPLLFSSMVVATGAIVYEREKGTLKKIRTSPARPLNVLFGKTLAALFQTAISILIMAVLAYFLLAPTLNWNAPLLVPVMFLGSINGIALGLIISCIGRAPQEASNAATTIAIVLQFFIGMYFPAEYLPSYLQQIGSIIPMTYAAQAIRSIMIKGASISDLLQPIITLVVSAAILFAIGILLYKRWVEKE